MNAHSLQMISHRPHPNVKHHLLPFCIAASLALNIGVVRAAADTWNPIPADANWSNAANWNSLPVAADSLFFDGSTITTLNNDFAAGTQFNGLTFNADASAFTLGGNAVTLVGSLTNSSLLAQTINFNLALNGATSNFTTTGGGGDLTINGAVAGNATVTKVGQGTLTLTNANSYSGLTTIAGGTIVYGSSSLPSRTQSFGELRNSVDTDATVVSVLGNSGNSTLSFSTYTSAAGVTDGGTMNFVTSGGTATSNRIIVATATVNSILRSRAFFNGADFAYVGTSNVLRAPVYGTDAGFSIATGVLTAASHNLVTSSITNQGAAAVITLKFGGTGAVDLTQSTGTNLQIGTGSGVLAGGLLRSGGGSTTISGGTITTAPGVQYIIRTDTVNDTLVIDSDVLRGNDNVSVNHLVKSGAGLLALNGNDSYFGNTYLTDGTLLVNGTHGPVTPQTAVGFYQVAAGSTLGGDGVITAVSGTTAINGTLAPGDGSQLLPANQTGSLDFGGTVVFFGGSTFAAQIGGNSNGDGQGFYDQFNLTAGSVGLQAGVTLSLSLVNGYAPQPGDAFYLLTQPDGGTFSTFFNNTTEGSMVDLGGGVMGEITYQANWQGSQGASSLTGGNDVAVFIPGAVPEPSTLLLVSFGLFGMMLYIRRSPR